MANLQKIIKVTQAQYNTLASGGTVGDYTGLDENYLYLVKDEGIESLITRVTYSQLKSLRDNKQLLPGMRYQITNYKTTTKAYNTSAAGHDFDVIVLALSEDTLAEDAKAIWHNGDSYFMRQYLNRAQWMTPLPDLATIDTKFKYFIQSGNDPRENYDRGNNFTQLTTVVNQDDVEVPAVLDTAPDGDDFYDCYYVYDGTYQLIRGQNELVSVQYVMNIWNNDIEYTNVGNSRYKSSDIFTVIDTETRNKPVSASWYDGADPVGNKECILYSVYEENGETRYSTDDHGNVAQIRKMTTAIHPRWNISVPAFYGNKHIWSNEQDPEYDDPDEETVDYEHIYVFDGQNIIDGDVYDRWIKFSNSPDPEELYLEDMNFCTYYLTWNFVDAELEEINIPLLYKSDGLYKGFTLETGVDYDDVFKYWDNYELDGVEYSRWLKYSGNSGSSGQTNDIYYSFILTQKIVEDNEFTITQDQLTNAAGAAVTVYDKWVEYYPNGDGWQTNNIHLSTKMVEADIKNVPVAKLDAWDLKYCLDNNLDRFDWADTAKGKGVIYYMKDEYNNECPYDFKNILFTNDSYGIDSSYTFSSSNNEDRSISTWACYNNTIKSNTSGISHYLPRNIFYHFSNIYGNYIGKNSTDNLFISNGGNSTYNNKIGDNCSVNKIYYGSASNIIGNSSSSNTIQYNAYNNIIGNNSSNNYIYQQSSYNVIQNNASGNTLNRQCNYNIIGDGCYNNYLNTGCENNIFLEQAHDNVLSNNSAYNKFIGAYSNNTGQNCKYNTFEQYARSNTIGNYSEKNTFKQDANNNILGTYALNNIFGNGVHHTYFGTSGSQINYVKNVIVDSECSYINLTHTSDSGSPGTSNYLQNIHLHMGINGTSGTAKNILIKRNLSYETEVKPADAKEIILE